MLRLDFLAGVMALATASALPPSYVPISKSGLDDYLADLRAKRSEIASMTIYRYDPDFRYEGTMRPKLLERAPLDCETHRVESKSLPQVRDLVGTILSARLRPSPDSNADTKIGVVFRDRRGKRLWSLYLADSIAGTTPSAKGFFVDDRIWDWVIRHFDAETKNSCKH